MILPFKGRIVNIQSLGNFKSDAGNLCRVFISRTANRSRSVNATTQINTREGFNMNISVEWHSEFARVISCKRCTSGTDRNLLRDDGENVPQPGYIGPHYDKSRVLLVGQNPGMPFKHLIAPDRPYTAALRALRDAPTPQQYSQLSAVLKDFIPAWPVHGNYFPLEESGLSLEDIGYFNIVRCRTLNNRLPGKRLTSECVDKHFVRWLSLLAPNVVVFIGKWAWEQGKSPVESGEIPCAFVNRQRSLSQLERTANRDKVAALVRQHRG